MVFAVCSGLYIIQKEVSLMYTNVSRETFRIATIGLHRWQIIIERNTVCLPFSTYHEWQQWPVGFRHDFPLCNRSDSVLPKLTISFADFLHRIVKI